MIVRLIEEGVSLAPISRASGIPVQELQTLNVARNTKVADTEELGQLAAMVAWRALEEGLRILDEGSEATRIRLITSIAGHPLRRMQTDTSKQQVAMRGLLDQILSGGGGYMEDVPDDE